MDGIMQYLTNWYRRSCCHCSLPLHRLPEMDRRCLYFPRRNPFGFLQHHQGYLSIPVPQTLGKFETNGSQEPPSNTTSLALLARSTTTSSVVIAVPACTLALTLWRARLSSRLVVLMRARLTWTTRLVLSSTP